MSATPVTPFSYGHDDSNDPEYFEIVGGRWIKKESVGRRRHSQLNSIVTDLLTPFAEKLGGTVTHEWTIVRGEERVIPDVTFSFPNFEERDGYLVAPAFLVVESLSPGQRLNAMSRKCTDVYHQWGTHYCWILDYRNEQAYEVHQEAIPDGPQSILTAGSEIQLHVDEIYSRLRKR